MAQRRLARDIVFFGTEDFSLTSLQALIDHGFTPALVITKPDTKRGRGQKLTAPLVKQLAQQHAIAVSQPTKLAQIAPLIADLDRPLGVLVSFGKIIPKSIIDLFIPGIINVHPSLLPQWRGPSPIESAILSGQTTTGVSLMQLVPAMDAGPVYSQQSVALTGSETQSSLYQRLGQLGAQLLTDSLPAIASGDLTPTAQDDTAATYSHLLQKSDGTLDPQALTADQAERAVRSYELYPRSRIINNTQQLIVTKAHVATAPLTTLDNRYKDGNYLVIDELIAPSGKKMSAVAYLRGNQSV